MEGRFTPSGPAPKLVTYLHAENRMIRELNLILLQGTQGDLDEVRVADLEAGIDRIDEMLLPLAYGPQRHGHRLRLDKNQMEDQAVILNQSQGEMRI